MTSDKFFVYRPLLDLIGLSEGTDKGDGYNETLNYGAYTGGDVELVAMTLDQVDALQTKMLRHPKNEWKSSAAGRYQIVRTTLRAIRDQLGLTGAERFDAAMQDRMACYLLGVRGIDKWLAGRLKLGTLINNLAREWASLPTTDGKGFYDGQHAGVTVVSVKAALAEVKRRHGAGQPVPERAVEEVEEKLTERTSWWQKLIGFFGAGGLGGGFLYGLDWQALAVGLAFLLLVVVLFIVFRRWALAAWRDVRDELAGGLVLAVLLLLPAPPAGAHDALPTAAQPQGWTYPFSHCSGYDCRAVSTSAVREGGDGYHVPSGEIVAYADARVKDSPDGEFHWCTVAGKNDGRTICLFVPPRSY